MEKNRNKIILKTSIIGIITNILLASFKAIIGWFASSIAITMDAVNNLTDAVSSIITIIGTSVASKDPDKKHPFGHGRTEYISTLAISIIIIYAGITALIQSIKSIITPKTPEYNNLMLLILIVAVVAKVFLSIFFKSQGKKAKSEPLIASGKDALSDVLISTVTIIAAIIYLCFGLSLEAYLALLISILIIKSGAEILIETLSKILGEGASVEFVKAIKKTIVEHENVNGAYDLVFNNYGQDVYVASVHIEVPETLNANEIDVLCRHITQDILDEYGVQLTAIGIYSKNLHNPEIAKIEQKVQEIALSHEHVNQIHGFYVNIEEKIILFDMVISFDEKSRSTLYEHVIEHLKQEFPTYEIRAGMDADFNEI